MKPNSDTPLYSIGTAARLLGISVHTMRMYERSGLIVPYKNRTHQRLYSDNDIERLRCVRSAINVQKISIEGIRRVLSLIPCWAIVHCTAADRESCPAYNGHPEPCWALRKKGSFCSERDCRTCEVYTDFGDCGSIKERIKDLLKSRSNRNEQ
jgi:MerR family transcriptional regulator/heat shock protein HspR